MGGARLMLFGLMLGTLAAPLAAVPDMVIAGNGSALAASAGRILVLPWSSINARESDAWMGGAMQQSLLADLARALPGGAWAGVAPAQTTDDALKAARQAGARMVVFGSFQSVDGMVRFTGQVLDATDGRAIAGLKATGSDQDLFLVEDEISTQMKRAVLTAGPRASEPIASSPTAQELAIEPSGPVRIAVNGDPPSAAEQYAVPTVYSSDAGQAAVYRHTYSGDYGWGCYGFGPGYCGIGYGCFPFSRASYGLSIYNVSYGRSAGFGYGGRGVIGYTSSSGVAGPGQPTPAPIFGATLNTVSVPGRGIAGSSGSTAGAGSSHHASAGHGRR